MPANTTRKLEFLETGNINPTEVSEAKPLPVTTEASASSPLPTYDVNVYDASATANKVKEVAPEYSRYSDPVEYTEFTPADTDYDEGDVISCAGYNTLNLYYTKTAADDGSTLKFVGLLTVDGATDYQETSLGTPTGGATAVSLNTYTIASGEILGATLSIPTNGVPFCRLDCAKTADTGSNATITSWYNLAWV